MRFRPRARAAAGMQRERAEAAGGGERLAPMRAVSWARAEQGDAAWTAQAEGESSGRNAERELIFRRSRGREQRQECRERTDLQAEASVAPVRAVS